MRSMVFSIYRRFCGNDDILSKQNMPFKRSVQIICWFIRIKNNPLDRKIDRRRYLSAVQKELINNLTILIKPEYFLWSNNRIEKVVLYFYLLCAFSGKYPHFLLSSRMSSFDSANEKRKWNFVYDRNDINNWEAGTFSSL